MITQTKGQTNGSDRRKADVIDGRLAVAYERGGRGYSVTVLTYDANARTGLMAVSGIHPLLPNQIARDGANGQAACQALEWALDA